MLFFLSVREKNTMKIQQSFFWFVPYFWIVVGWLFALRQIEFVQSIISIDYIWELHLQFGIHLITDSILCDWMLVHVSFAVRLHASNLCRDHLKYVQMKANTHIVYNVHWGIISNMNDMCMKAIRRCKFVVHGYLFNETDTYRCRYRKSMAT